jgi:hypothetical protein
MASPTSEAPDLSAAFEIIETIENSQVKWQSYSWPRWAEHTGFVLRLQAIIKHNEFHTPTR